MEKGLHIQSSSYVNWRKDIRTKTLICISYMTLHVYFLHICIKPEKEFLEVFPWLYQHFMFMDINCSVRSCTAHEGFLDLG
ncbi:hypothetical protein ATANTOWER_027908 [Ataeniobius toweri]|uniref:Uncharacterized protein n=1 Tax=Ataeniobius toweri TaxID=208326 RepID=A0ABU7CIR4_9TELE|nr:hypothetical protein [Ataeniobius toweri]